MLSKSKAKFGQFVKSKKINVFGAFLILSFLMLVIIKLSENYDETLTYELSFKNLPENEVLNLEKTPKLSVGVKGFGFYLFKEYFRRKKIVVDFDRDVSKTGSAYVWLTKAHKNDIQRQIGSRLELDFIRPDTLKFPFEVLSMKKVPIKLNAEVSYVQGYDSLEGLKFNPDSVNVVGSEEALKSVEIIETQLLQLSDISSDIKAKIALRKPKSSGKLRLPQNEVTINSKVTKFTEGNFEIPIKLINVPKNLKINYFPKSISVSFLVSLNDFKSVEPEDFEIVCDYEAVLNSESTFLIPKLTKESDKVKNVQMRQKKVEYIINQ